MIKYRRILSPVDFSKASQRAFETAVDLAARLDAEVLAIPYNGASYSGRYRISSQTEINRR